MSARANVPRWAAYALATGALALLVAVAGLFWDVAYHIDHGRDVSLFTPAHVMVLAGLLGIGIAALGSIAFATRDRAAAGIRVGPLRVPFAAVPLGLMAAAAAAGFPLDDLWHRTYGIDVTLWSPTHLVMIGGGVMSTFALCLYVPEARLQRLPGRLLALRRVTLHGAVLIGLSVFLLEFDYGIPQWRAIFHPLLVAITASLGLVAARYSLGRWGATKAAAFYLFIRLWLALFVKAVGHEPPAMPLLLPEALLVEAAFALAPRLRPLGSALLAGLLVAGPGLAVEWLWTQIAYPMPWHASLLPWMWLPLLGSLAAAVAGLGFGAVVGGRPAGLPGAAAIAAVVAVGVLLAIPLPRSSSDAQVTIATAPDGAPRQVADRFGRTTTEQDYNVEVQAPASAADGADWFTIVAWQGGGRRVIALREVSPGHYRAAQPVPTGGSWKSMVFLARGDVMAAAPISFPADPEYRLAGTPVAPERTERFQPAASLLMAESHGGAPWVAAAGYAMLLAVAALWLAAIAAAGALITGHGVPARLDSALPGGLRRRLRSAS